MKKLLLFGAMLFFAWLPMMAQNSQAQTIQQLQEQLNSLTR